MKPRQIKSWSKYHYANSGIECTFCEQLIRPTEYYVREVWTDKRNNFEIRRIHLDPPCNREFEKLY